ncbi:MAG TPA: hypothetical protein VE486_05100 [Candidatus Baltobacteraceae bacterium]|nr:hypothetical protein [Candidatus Baltobacteraceae bacterium]
MIAALVICAPIACSEEILPQLIAQIASLDHDHGIFLHATSDGVDLILTHHAHVTRAGDEGRSLDESQPAHVIHMISGSATVKQSASLIVSNAKQLVAYFPTAITAEWRTFVPRLPLAYSRPPPEAMILRLDRSALAGLLI